MIQGDLLADLPVFVTAVEAGGFSAAATRLNLTRSAVGRTVACLERRFGVRLFHRTTRSLALTEEGQTVFEREKRALAEIQNATAMLESGRRDIAGRLRVSMPVLFGRLCVAPILIRLADAHPRLELDLNFSDRLVDPVEDGFDLVGAQRFLTGLAGTHRATDRASAHARLCSAGLSGGGRHSDIPGRFGVTPRHPLRTVWSRALLAVPAAGRSGPGDHPVEPAPVRRCRGGAGCCAGGARARVAALLAHPPRRDSGAPRRGVGRRAGACVRGYALWPATPHPPCG